APSGPERPITSALSRASESASIARPSWRAMARVVAGLRERKRKPGWPFGERRDLPQRPGRPGGPRRQLAGPHPTARPPRTPSPPRPPHPRPEGGEPPPHRRGAAAGQPPPRPPAAERGAAGGIHGHAAVGSRDHGRRALEQHHAGRALGEPPRRRDP